MFQFRYMQTEAIEAIFGYWAEEPGHPLVVMATGIGKSATMAGLTCRLLNGWSDMRVMNVTHVVELVEGNFKELIGMWNGAPAGIYAASLNRRDRRAQIVFAQLQTVWDKAAEIGHIDVLEIDEVHLVPSNENAMYQTFIAALLAINPDMKIVGFTATPYRLDSGRLDEGEDRMFDRVVYDYGIAQGIADGYLTRLTSKPTGMQYDMTGVHRLGGDFKKNELAAAVDKDDLTEKAVAEVMAAAAAEGRQCALFFCTSVEHAFHVRDAVRRYGKVCETITGNLKLTPKAERRRIIEGFKRGDIWGVTNDSVMTTGTNVPRIDLIADMAPTQSCSRYVQKAGRGTRVIYAPGFDLDTVEGRLAAIAAGPKPTCLYMNFAGNIERHGPVDVAEPKKPGKGDGEAPIKLCPTELGGCSEICHASARVCPNCGFQFPIDDTPKISATASAAPILSTDEPIWHEVTGREFAEHHKPGSVPSVKVTYEANGKRCSEWVCPQHGEHPKGRYAKSKADRWWHDHGGARPFPATVDEFLDRAGELKITSHAVLKKDGRYWNVVDTRVSEDRDASYVRPPKASGNIADARWKPPADWDSDIPF